MSESKLTYLSLVFSVCAAAVSAVTAGVAVLGNSSSLNQLQTKVSTLTQENSDLAQKLAVLSDNRARIDELDIGLTALASVANVDLDKLAQAIAVARSQGQEPVEVNAAAAPIEQQEPAVVASAKPGQDQKVEAIPQPEPVVSAPSVAPTGSEAPVVQAGGGAVVDDNPFAVASNTAAVPGEPAALSISAETAAPTKTSTIKEVDAILGKRISENWYKPTDASPDLTAIIRLEMARDGKVANVTLAKESGNKAFDASVMQAVHSIAEIAEVRGLSDADFKKAYASRNIQFTPQMGG